MTITIGGSPSLNITPIKVDKSTNNFATMDIETMNINGIQMPVAISSCNGIYKKNSQVFIIDPVLLQSFPELAINNLWKQYFDYLINSGSNLIFAHNLGNFDGYFLYKALINHFDPITVGCLIDDSKSFISITLNINNVKIVWKDSLRIIPVSLDKLCQVFNVEGKLSKYDIRFNDISLFNNTKLWSNFKNYALQDAIALYKALVTAQAIYFNDYNIDITSIFSSPTLSLKIFRSKFLSLSIPILSKGVDEFVKPLIHNGKLISIKVRLNIEGYVGKTIIFKDSYLLLPQSLRNLCNAFNISVPKGYFPFKLIDIFYTGLIPRFEYWTGITLSEYLKFATKYVGKVWSFKDEAIKYCKLDCQTLHQILTIFNELIFNEFKININTIYTLPALAMRIYKSQFMPKNSIYQLSGPVEQDIRQAYTGGAVDVYIPHNRNQSFFSKILKKLYIYDVNSLYPFVMANTPMPVGLPKAFSGNIRDVEPEAFGFFYCKITSPAYLEHPILQRRIKTSEGTRTIAGLGTWEGWIFSGEMDNAMNPKYGYTFEIIKGYQFDKGNIFKEYVETMYNLRLQYEKGHPMNLIAKLLMNSLYGKFGMKLENTLIDIFNTYINSDNELLDDLIEVYGPTIQDFIKLDNHIVTVRKSLHNFKYTEALDHAQDDSFYHGLDVNIAIASAVTGGARMWMSVLKNNPLFKLYYSDTDSAVTNKPLPSFMVGTNLGQFKLEHVIERGVFLAPKVYALITDDGQEIIKVKGISPDTLNDIHINDIEQLLVKDSSKEFNQEKWFKKVITGEITISEIAYTLKVTSNKRSSIFIKDESGKEIFDSTKPYNYNDIIKNN